MFTHTTQCIRGVLDPPVSAFSLSLYRHPFLYTLFSSRFTLIINNNKKGPPLHVYRSLGCKKRHMTGWLINFLTFSTQRQRLKLNRWLKDGVSIPGTFEKKNIFPQKWKEGVAGSPPFVTVWDTPPIKFGNIALTTTTIHRVWYHL